MSALRKYLGFTLMIAAFTASASRALGESASDASSQPYVICKNQTYALCATAQAFVFQQVAYAKCQIKRGDSISAPPLYYPPNTKQNNICDFNAEGAANGYMASTYSLPPSVLKDHPGSNQAVYTCPRGSSSGYAQCDGGACFTSTRGQEFPGVGKLTKDEIVCSCPITKTGATAPADVGFQFIGPFPCQQEAFAACSQTVGNGSLIPVGSPPGAGRVLTIKLTGNDPHINECVSK